MSERFFDLGPVGKGRVWIGPKPDAAGLDDWASALKSRQIDHVVSLIEEAEVERHGLQTEGRELDAAGIGFTRFPVDDFDVPDGGALRKLIDGLSARLKRGENLFLHCAGGVGRAGTTTCCLLVEFGTAPEHAMQHASDVRGVPVPETDEQTDFIHRWYQHHVA